MYGETRLLRPLIRRYNERSAPAADVGSVFDAHHEYHASIVDAEHDPVIASARAVQSL